METVRSRNRRASTRPVRAIAVGAIAALVLAACGSSSKSSGGSPSSTTAGSPDGSTTTVVTDKSLGIGVTATTIKVGVALVDFGPIEQFTDVIRQMADQKKIYGIYIDYINAHGGINGRKIVPVYKFYSPLGSAGPLAVCTSLTQDEKVFAVVGTFIDFSGDAQQCIAKQEKRVLMTFNLTQAMIDKVPPGLMLTPGLIPERSASILIQLLTKQKLLDGRTVAVLGDVTQNNVVKKTIVPGLKKAGVKTGISAVLNVGTTGDTSAAVTQLDSFMERWKTEHVDTIFLSGDLASTKIFVQQVKRTFPNMEFIGDNTDVLNGAQQLQQAGVKPNPYEGVITAGGPTAKEYDESANYKYCADIYKNATGQAAPDAEHTIKLPNGKINDVYGAFNDACQLMAMFHDIGQRVGPYLNNTNWENTVNNFGPITNRGSGPYATLTKGKYSADDNWRLQSYDSTLGTTGLWKPITPLADITGN